MRFFVLAKRKMSVTELAEKMRITMANISILKDGKARAIRFSTLAVYPGVVRRGDRIKG